MQWEFVGRPPGEIQQWSQRPRIAAGIAEQFGKDQNRVIDDGIGHLAIAQITPQPAPGGPDTGRAVRHRHG
ncbi:hypothetical protein OG455_20720 [Kitasatospora sp. NBC_01287]|uniref:hypothetical protein n=1 Tax=Kitasatospora sp. NBC_01287 TaxID=2903573 RepID=UPI0022540815|nr:hypothetical protein [Kitasatospora sp. NBC_01287]MCX4747912.1 hypothetical protein [Kitasatospora sp. NBC_01287]